MASPEGGMVGLGVKSGTLFPNENSIRFETACSIDWLFKFVTADILVIL